MFKPIYTITPGTATLLMRISALKEDINLTPISPIALARLRATARMSTVHYSIQIEGNRLTLEQVGKVIENTIVYLPPEAQDVPLLMKELVHWINEAPKLDIPVPLIAAIAHYQFVTVHPYYDGNGRTARLLATLILHQGGYDLKGIYCLEEYYAKELSAYYQAVSIGPSHNYYFGRAESDITSWINYLCERMIKSFEQVKQGLEKHCTKILSDKLSSN